MEAQGLRNPARSKVISSPKQGQIPYVGPSVFDSSLRSASSGLRGLDIQNCCVSLQAVLPHLSHKFVDPALTMLLAVWPGCKSLTM